MARKCARSCHSGDDPEQPQERIVDEFGHLHRVPVALAAQQRRRAAPQFRLHQRVQPVNRVGIPSAVRLQQGSDVLCHVSHSSMLRGQSSLSSRDRLRSASTRPPVWQRAQ